jgi:hypothetical protein
MMKSGAEVLVAGVRLTAEEAILIIPFFFPRPLPVGADPYVVAAFLFDTPDVCVLACVFLVGVFLVRVMV